MMNSLKSPCSPDEAALKSFFLGPQAENAEFVESQIKLILEHWFTWRKSLYPDDGPAISPADINSSEFLCAREKVQTALADICSRLEKEVPQFSPRYVGHMFSEVSLPALFGHFVALLHNPNNLSTEAARVGAFIEVEAIAALARMIGFSGESATGHFTSGGTIANFEGLWRARYRFDHWLALGCVLNEKHGLGLSYTQSANMGWAQFESYVCKYDIKESEIKARSVVATSPWTVASIYEKSFGKQYAGPVILIPASKHYSWLKAVSLLGIGEESFWAVELDDSGRICTQDLKSKIACANSLDRPIMMVVSIAGTTELGSCDPISQVQDLIDSQKDSGRHIWHHVDAAYGGYFCSIISSQGSQANDLVDLQSYRGIKRADSVTLDPHKLGYVPYACGAIVFPSQVNYRVAAFEAKYLESGRQSVDRWMKTIEGSRPASGAAATWMTAQTIGLDSNGYGKILGRTLQTKKVLEHKILADLPACRVLSDLHSNLIAVAVVGNEKTLTAVNHSTLELIKAVNASGKFIVSKTVLRKPNYTKLIDKNISSWGIAADCDDLVLLRMTMMNPFFINKESKVHYLKEFVKLLSDSIIMNLMNS